MRTDDRSICRSHNTRRDTIISMTIDIATVSAIAITNLISNVTPRASFWHGHICSSQGTLLQLLSRTTDDLPDLCPLVHFDWLKRAQWLRLCQQIDVILSRNAVRLAASLSHLFTLSYPLLVGSSRDACVTRTVGFTTEFNGLLSTVRFYGPIVRYDSFICSRHLLRRIRLTTRICGTFPWSWPVCHLEMVSRFVVFDFFSVVALSETGCFSMSTLDWLLEQVRWRLRRGFVARISSVTSCLFYRGDRVRSIVSVHCRGFFSVSMGNDFDEDRIDAITYEFYGRKLDADRIRTVAD